MKPSPSSPPVFDSLMLRVLMPPVIALTQLFALYVLVHGHGSPGGGFQAGVLLAASLVVPLLLAERGPGYWIPSPRAAAALAVAGLSLYAGIGAVCLAFGGFLDYAALPLPGLAEPARRYLGILWIEIAVTIGVAGSALSVFYTLSEEP